MADLIKAPINYAVSAGGQFVKGGSVVFGFINIRPDAANPATLKPIYLDSALTSQAANPQGLSSDAVFDQANNGVLFGADDDSYSVIIYDANGVELSYIPVYNLSDATAAANAQAAEAGAIVAQDLAEVAQAAAEAAAVAANLSYEEFVNRYLGAYSSDPALDPAGNAPIEGSLYWSTGSAAFKVFTMGAWQFTNLTFGTAAYVDVGTDSDQIPLNSDLKSAAFADTGLLTGNVPTADDLSMVGETVNYTGGNYQPDDANGLGSPRWMANRSGGVHTLNSSFPASQVEWALASVSGVVVSTGATSPSGSWKNVSGRDLSDNEFGLYVRGI